MSPGESWTGEVVSVAMAATQAPDRQTRCRSALSPEVGSPACSCALRAQLWDKAAPGAMSPMAEYSLRSGVVAATKVADGPQYALAAYGS